MKRMIFGHIYDTNSAELIAVTHAGNVAIMIAKWRA